MVHELHHGGDLGRLPALPPVEDLAEAHAAAQLVDGDPVEAGRGLAAVGAGEAAPAPEEPLLVEDVVLEVRPVVERQRREVHLGALGREQREEGTLYTALV